MKVDLSKLFDNPGLSQDIDALVNLGSYERGGHRIFPEPVKVRGRAENRAGIVYADFAVDFKLETVCDRCLTDISRREQMEFSHILVLSLNREDNDELIVVADGQLDLAELVSSDILLGLPTLMVCDEGCKGLCTVCGKNLNEGPCDCREQVRDSRFDKLRELLED